jgi:uncharacterized DUF497 family protein
MVELEWDDEKNRINRVKHGWDFADAIRVFRDPLFYIAEDRSLDYGERRHRIIGYAGHKLVTVIYTERGGTIRVISAYKTSPQERRDYESKAR